MSRVTRRRDAVTRVTMGRPALLCLAWLLALVRGGYNALATVTFYVDSMVFMCRSNLKVGGKSMSLLM